MRLVGRHFPENEVPTRTRSRRIVDNSIVLLILGAMNAGLSDVLFWASLALALAIAFVAAFPVNRYLIARGSGHAVIHQYHGH